MKPGAPWSVKGIEPQARETAKSAARRAGMTLGEWLNQVILETGTDTAPVADPMRAPDDWMRETGEALPWTRPIEEMSASISARLAASEAGNTNLLGSIEIAIAGISKRLVELDERAPSSASGGLETRLARIETVQKRALSKDHLRTLETAVSQISVVFDTQTEKQATITRDQNRHIEQAQRDLAEFTAQLEQTENRIDQALCAVEAAAELYEITDKQTRMIDTLVMDVAAVHEEQKITDTRSSGNLSGIVSELDDLKGQLKALEDKSVDGASDAGAKAKLAAQAISEQITANEAKTAGSVSQIEEQITGLSQLLDQSLQVQQSGIEELRAALDTIAMRVNTLEDKKDVTPPEAKIEADTPHAQTGAAQAPDLTFKTLDQQNSRNVNVNMAVTIDPEFVKAEEPEAPEVLPLPEALPLDVTLQPEDPVKTDLDEAAPAEMAAAQESETFEELPALGPMGSINLAEDIPADIPQQPDFEPEPDLAQGQDIEIMAGIDVEQDFDVEVSDHFSDAETIEDEPLTFADIFGSSEETTLGDTETDPAADPFIDPEADAALREAVTNISSIRASWAAKSQAEGGPGSMRQIVDTDETEASRRGWALTAGGMIVGLMAISGVLVYSGETEDLIDAGKRPALLDQIATWFPGRSSAQPDEEISTAETATVFPAALTPADMPLGLEEAAQTGDPKAQFALGRAFAVGNGRPVDRAAAYKWYQAAATQGLAIAQYVLGSLHERGIDVAQDTRASIDWYAAAARGGNQRSMHNLAVAYARGDVIDQDLTQSAYWFSEAAELGLSDAQYNLALLHERGLGVEKDLTTAWKWYRLSAAAGDKSAAAQVTRLGEKLTADQREDANKAVGAWHPRDLEPIANGQFDISPVAWNNSQQRGDLATAQARLISLGYSLASSDGIMDPSTRKAIRSFQAANDLDVTGAFSSGLFETLTDAETNRSSAD